MDFSTISWLGVVVATISTFVLGAIWYGPIFGKAWMNEMGFTEEQLKEGNMLKIYGTTFVLEFIMATLLAYTLSGHGEPLEMSVAIYHAIIIGLGFIGLSKGVNYLFNRHSFKVWFIDSFYFVISFTIMAIILTVL
ncbi:MAG: DUF1761 domain-containing protein [Cytophagales bacterium]|nr:DUF1761 domain-containing protein [Cytophagales bacterium]